MSRQVYQDLQPLAKFEILLVKIFSLIQKTNPMLAATIE